MMVVMGRVEGMEQSPPGSDWRGVNSFSLWLHRDIQNTCGTVSAQGESTRKTQGRRGMKMMVGMQVVVGMKGILGCRLWWECR